MTVTIPATGAHNFIQEWVPPVEPPHDEGTDAPNPLLARILNRTQLSNLPTPEPLIADTIDKGTVAGLFGYWGTGKSFLALDWAACMSTGKPWQGRDVTQSRVLYIAAEGAYGLDARLQAWEYAWGHKIDPNYLDVLPTAVNLTKAGPVSQLCQLITSEGYDVIFVDTLARSIVGADENSAKDMGIVVDSLYKLRDATDHGTIIPLHHTGKDKLTVRGSSALESGLDTVYVTEGDGYHVKVTRTKRKDGPVQDTHNLQIKSIEHTGSAIISSGDVRGHEFDNRADQLMSVFMSAFSVTGASKADLRNAANFPPASYSRALNKLVEDGRLNNIGTDKVPFYKAAA
ncbi:AAA family ATPase [Rhodococcus koreensis]